MIKILIIFFGCSRKFIQIIFDPRKSYIIYWFFVDITLRTIIELLSNAKMWDKFGWKISRVEKKIVPFIFPISFISLAFELCLLTHICWIILETKSINCKDRSIQSNILSANNSIFQKTVRLLSLVQLCKGLNVCQIYLFWLVIRFKKYLE